jgi:hypothetical protein
MADDVPISRMGGRVIGIIWDLYPKFHRCLFCGHKDESPGMI